MFRVVLASVALAISLAGCGGSDSPTGEIESVAKDYYEASNASCSKEGIAVFLGEREDVYGCVLDDVPPENRPIAHIESSTQTRCYIFTEGDVFEVTDKLQDLADAQEAAGVTPDEFPCLGN